MHGFKHIFGGVDTGGEGQVSLDLPIQDGDPAQGQAQFIGVAQDQVRDDFQVFQVEIGLVETVEKHQAIRTGFDQPFGDIGDGGEEWAEFDCQGDFDAFAHIADQSDVILFDLAWRSVLGSVGR